MTPAWRVGPAVSFNLLGSRTVTRGFIPAGLDYSMFDAALLFTHLNARGPVARWSVGPGVASPRVDLSASGERACGCISG